MGRHRRSMRVPRRTRLQFDSLEQRRLLAIDIVGTAGDDSIAIIGTDTGFYASVNGQVTNYTTSGLTDVNVDGLGGKDSVQVHKIQGAATLGAFSGLIGGGSIRIVLSHFETQYVFWAADANHSFDELNRAYLNGTSSDDIVYHFDTHAIMQGSAGGVSFFNEVIGYEKANCDAGGGSDTLISSLNLPSHIPDAIVIDASTRVSHRVRTPAPASISILVELRDFEKIYAYSSPHFSGVPYSSSCTLTGSSGNDVFYGLANTSILTGQGYFYQTIGYDFSSADGNGGVDTALFYGSTSDDAFSAIAGRTNFMRKIGLPNLCNTENFELVYAFAVAGGKDVARFGDSYSNVAGDDTLFATSSYSLLYRPGSYLIQAVGFAEVEVTSNNGYDTAIILDQPGVNQLTANSDRVEIAFANRNRVLIQAFDIVYANGLYGGTNRKITASQPRFPIVYAGIWLG